MQKWMVIDTGKSSAFENMAFDAELLQQLSLGQKEPILHLYAWDAPSATYGHFIDPFRFIRKDAALNAGLQLARRPTGGGMIFHLTDFAFSIIIPADHIGYSVNVLENYAFVNHLIIEVIKKFTNGQASPHLLLEECQGNDTACKHFCMAKPTKYDVMLEGRKVGGGAQRRTKKGFLHQGSISIALPPIDYLENILLPQPELIESMKAVSYALIPGQVTQEQLEDARGYMNNIFKGLLTKS